MRDKLMILLMVPALILPVVIIAAGGDLEVVRREVIALTRVPVVLTVYAQNGSPSTMPSGEVMPSGPVIPSGPVVMPPLIDPTTAAPTLTRWATISLSILLGLIAIWYLTEPRQQPREI